MEFLWNSMISNKFQVMTNNLIKGTLYVYKKFDILYYA